MKHTSETGDTPANPGKPKESGGTSGQMAGRKDILKKILWVIVVVFAWLAIKRLVITTGNESLMIFVFIAAAALVLWVTQKIKW